MKKWILGLAILLLATTPIQAQYTGIYGEYFEPMDTVRIPLSVHDNTGLLTADADTIVVTRYLNGLLVDSLLSAGTQGEDHAQVDALGAAGAGKYEIKFRAAEAVDSIGQYTVFVRVAIAADEGLTKYVYQVTRGEGLGALYDIQWFLGAADDGYRVLHPDNGGAPKDSVQYYSIGDFDGSASLNLGDTLHVSTIHFYHSNNQRILDSSKTIFHYGNP